MENFYLNKYTTIHRVDQISNFYLHVSKIDFLKFNIY